MKAFILHFYIETKTSIRKKQQMFLNYIFPLGFYLMMGAVMPQLNPLFLADMIPAMITFAVMTSTFLSIPEQIVSGRDSGIFRGYRINGVNSWSLITIPMLSSLLHMSIVSVVIIITAPLLFNAPVPQNILSMLPIGWLTLFSFSGISLLIGVISSSSRVSVMLSQIFFIPSMLIGGLMIPYDILPEKIRIAAVFLPSTHSMNLFKAISFSKPAGISPIISAAVLAGTGAVAVLLARLLFKWDGKKN